MLTVTAAPAAAAPSAFSLYRLPVLGCINKNLFDIKLLRVSWLNVDTIKKSNLGNRFYPRYMKERIVKLIKCFKGLSCR